LGIFAASAAVGVDKINAPAIATQGAILQMFAHGIGAAGLFYLAGKLEELGGTRDIREFGGLGSVIPRYAFVFGFLIFSSLGLPFLAGFAAEILVFSGAFALFPLHTAFALLALLATAVFLLGITWVGQQLKCFVGVGPDHDVIEACLAAVLLGQDHAIVGSANLPGAGIELRRVGELPEHGLDIAAAAPFDVLPLRAVGEAQQAVIFEKVEVGLRREGLHLFDRR